MAITLNVEDLPALTVKKGISERSQKLMEHVFPGPKLFYRAPLRHCFSVNETMLAQWGREGAHFPKQIRS